MCKVCNESYPNNSTFVNWLFHHRPHKELHTESINILDTSITVILSDRLEQFTVEELQEKYNLDDQRVVEVTTTANRIISDIEDMLLTSMTGNVEYL